MEIGQFGVGALALIGHPANGRNGANVIVPTLATPTCHRGIMHRPTECKIAEDIPGEVVHGLSEAAPTALELRLVIDVIEDSEPMAGWRF